MLIAMATFIKNTERFQINNLMLYLKHLEQQEQAKHKTSRIREIIKLGWNQWHTDKKKAIQRINKTKSWFFEKINKNDIPLANLTKTRREKTKNSEIRIKRRDNIEHQANPGNHQGPLSKPLFK
jgi:hypothetical protein